MKLISILDTSICSSNLGDKIIIDSVVRILEEMFGDALFVSLPTHDVISKRSYELLNQSKFSFVGGTNLLSSSMGNPRIFKQWQIGLIDSLFVKDIILMGVGWWQYQNRPDLYTQTLYKRIFNKNHFHSVRDSYTEQQLKSIGIENVINTACPTMWSLSSAHCTSIPKIKSTSVLVTFTEYNQKYEADLALISLLENEYEKIYFWIQQPKDYQYMKEICGDKAFYIGPSLNALDRFLIDADIDYIGTRLHAGIRALQHKKRSLILAVDNRAREISKDTDLPVIDREDLSAVENWINAPYKIDIRLPIENIDAWKKQFLEGDH